MSSGQAIAHVLSATIPHPRGATGSSAIQHIDNSSLTKKTSASSDNQSIP